MLVDEAELTPGLTYNGFGCCIAIVVPTTQIETPTLCIAHSKHIPDFLMEFHLMISTVHWHQLGYGIPYLGQNQLDFWSKNQRSHI